jgi:flagellar L-ring protein precursor FlgH
MTHASALRRTLLAAALPLAVGACHHEVPPPVVAMSDTAPVRVGRQSWTSDRQTLALGDLILVEVDEFTLASANSGNSASDSRRRDLALNVAAAMSGGTGKSTDVALGSGNDASSRRSGTSTRQNRFTSELTARVVGFGPSGVIYIRGSKHVAIDGATQEVVLSGWVRPQDVRAQNVVLSSRIGDADLRYASTGDLDRPAGGLISRALGRLWP